MGGFGCKHKEGTVCACDKKGNGEEGTVPPATQPKITVYYMVAATPRDEAVVLETHAGSPSGGMESNKRKNEGGGGKEFRKKKQKRGRVRWKPQKFKCNLCDYAATTSQNLRIHRRTHTGEKPYRCDFDQCDYAATQSSNLRTHKRIHTKAGQARQKKQEQHVCRALLAAGYTEVTTGDWSPTPKTFVREKRINFGCLGATAKYARIDFVLNTGNALVFLEVDEHQHKFGYGEAGCDMKRMSRVMEALCLAGCHAKVHWVRYNPHAFKINGAKARGLKKKDREAVLVSKISALRSDDNAGSLQSIGYLFYDTDTSDLPTVVTADAAFESRWRAVTWCVVKIK